MNARAKDVERSAQPAVPLFHSGGDEARELGAILRDARVAHRRELADVASELRIREIYLRAIEDGRLSDLPGNTYAYGFVRAYAEYLGLDAADIARRFREAAGGGADQLNLVLPSPVAEGRMPTGAILLVAAIVALAAYGGWYYLSSQGRDAGQMIAALPSQIEAFIHRESAPSVLPPTAAAPTPSEAPAPAAPAAPQPVAGPVAPAAPTAPSAPAAPTTESQSAPAPTVSLPLSPAAKPAAPAPAAPKTSAATPPPSAQAEAPAEEDTAPLPPEHINKAAASEHAAAPAPTASAPAPATASAPKASRPAPAPAVTVKSLPPRPAVAPAPAVPAAASATPASTAETVPPPPPAPGATSPHDIVLVARADSWIELRSASGERVYSHVLRAGERYDVPNEAGLTMMTGNAGGLEVIVDGKEAPSLGAAGAVTRDISLDPARLLAGTAVPPQP